MKHTGDGDMYARLATADRCDVADVLTALRRGEEVEVASNASLALEVAHWQLQHTGWALVHKPGYLAIHAVGIAVAFLLWNGLVGWVAAVALALSFVTITTWLSHRAAEAFVANGRLVDDA